MASLVELGFRSALITGAGSGLGLAFTDALLTEGLDVWGTSRQPERLASREGFSPVGMDLADRASIDQLWDHLMAVNGGVDLLVANAGYGVMGGYPETDFGEWRKQIEAMLTGTMHLVHRALPSLRDRFPSTVVLVSSLAVDFPIPFLAGYNAVKAGLSGFAGGLMIESGRTGPYIVDFRPGDYRTSFNRSMGLSDSSFSDSEHVTRVARRLDKLMTTAPDPARAARDLVRAVRRKRHAVTRSGSVFQARLAPTFSRLLPGNWLRASARRYFRIN